MIQERVAGVSGRVVAAARVSRWLAARIALVLAIGVIAFRPLIANAAQPPVGMGTAKSFAVLAGAGLTNTGHTTITGDVGTFPTTSEAGFGACPAADCVTLHGTNHAGDGVTQGAKNDLVTAYDDAAGRTPFNTVGSELGGQHLVPGVYRSNSGAFAITGTVTLDAQGDPNGVFIFQAASALVTASSSRVSLLGGAQACNVFWQITSSVTLGTGSTFRGNIFALTSIAVTTGVTIVGRVLARNGTVTLDTDTITRATCAAATPPPTTGTPAPPSGGPGTGGGSTAGVQDLGLLLFGGSLLALAVGTFALRRRVTRRGLSS
jgi:hypothetical protein